MIIDAPEEFWDWVDALAAKAQLGDQTAEVRLDVVQALLEELEALPEPPRKSDETAILKWVRQSRRYVVWRVSHPYRKGVAVRLICWFPPDAPPWSLRFSRATRCESGTCSTPASVRAPTS